MARRKKHAEEAPREPTPKEILRQKQEREKNRRNLAGLGIVLGLVLLIVAAGAIAEFAVKPNSTMATVGDDKIITKDFWERVYLQQNQLQNQLVRLQQFEQQFGGQGFFTSQINQIEATLSSPFSLGIQVLDTMIEDEIIRQETAERTITVSDEEVAAELRAEVAAGQGAVTIPQATETAVAAVEATATASEWTPTPSPTIDISSTITATATSIPTPEPPATRPIVTDEQYDEGLAELEERLSSVAGMSLDTYREIIRVRLLREKLQEVVSADLVSPTQEQVHARHILLNVREAEPTPLPVPDAPTPEPTESPTPLPEGFPTPIPTPEPRGDDETLALAQEIRQRILDGEDFAVLASEFSDDPGSAIEGGDLGWFNRGMMVPPFEEAAFSLEPGEISEPVKTDFGYHIIEVVERDDSRPKDEGTLQQEQAQAFTEWLSEKLAATEIDRPDDLVSKLPSGLQPVGPVVQQPAAPQP